MENQLIYKKYVIHKHPPTILTLPAAIFPQKSTTIVCLGFFINSSSMVTCVDYKNILRSKSGRVRTRITSLYCKF